MNDQGKNSQTSDLNGKPSFWFLHVLGWMIYAVVFSADNLLTKPSASMTPLVIFGLLGSALIAAILTLPLRYIYRRCFKYSPRTIILTISACSLIVGLIWTPAKAIVVKKTIEWSEQFVVQTNKVNEKQLDPDNLARKQQKDNKQMSMLGWFSGSSYSFFMILVWSTFYFGINYHYRLLTQKQMHIEAVRLSHSAQIKMLRYQINPHFLFNTLNAIATLVSVESKEKAKGMLVRLSTFLRFSLDNDPEKKIYLHEEIKALMMYLEIEKMRFEDRLSISLRIDPETENTLVPSLLLQPLIENSIKYAIAKMANGGLIEINAKIIEDRLFIVVTDNGPNVSSMHDSSQQNGVSGVGLQNIKERLEVLYQNNHEFTYGKNDPVGFKVEIWIPVQKG